MAEILTDPLAHMLLLLTVLATAVMAASAALQGVRHELDLFGATVIAVAAAVGGARCATCCWGGCRYSGSRI